MTTSTHVPAQIEVKFCDRDQRGKPTSRQWIAKINGEYLMDKRGRQLRRFRTEHEALAAAAAQ